MKKQVLVLVGRTCSGKSTLESYMETRGWQRLISCTTRAPRSGEVPNVDYFFLNEEQFLKEDLMESIVFTGVRYGVSGKQIFDSDNDRFVVVVEPNGAKQVREYCAANDLDCFVVFLNTPSSLIIERFLARFVDVSEHVTDFSTFKKRLTALIEEESKWASAIKYDYVFTPIIGEGSPGMHLPYIYECLIQALYKKLPSLKGVEA